MSRAIRALAPVSLLAALALAAACAPPAPVRVEDAWVRAADSAATTAAYFTLVNDRADSLHVTGLSGDCAASISLHESVRTGRLVSMREVERLDVAPHGRLVLVPGGRHVMLTGLRRALRPGQRLDLVLHLSDGSQLPVPASVRS